MKKLFLCLLCLPLYFACEGDEAIPPMMLETDAGQDFVVEEDAVKEIQITAKSTDGRLLSLEIQSNDKEQGEVELLDSALRSQELNCTYRYKAPVFNKDRVDVRLTITVSNVYGNMKSSEVRLIVCKKKEQTEEPETNEE